MILIFQPLWLKNQGKKVTFDGSLLFMLLLLLLGCHSLTRPLQQGTTFAPAWLSPAVVMVRVIDRACPSQSIGANGCLDALAYRMVMLIGKSISPDFSAIGAEKSGSQGAALLPSDHSRALQLNGVFRGQRSEPEKG